MSIERERQLCACNAQLVLELNYMAKRLVLAERAMQLLDAASRDDEAIEIVAAWYATKKPETVE